MGNLPQPPLLDRILSERRARGIIASQLIAAHNAAMECYRRAMLSEQTLDGRRENLNQAIRSHELTRCFLRP